MRAMRVWLLQPSVAGLLALVPGSSLGQTGGGPTAPPDHVLAVQRMTLMPLAFTVNKGQWDSRVLFQARIPGMTIWFDKDGVTYRSVRRVEADRGSGQDLNPGNDPISTKRRELRVNSQVEGQLIRSSFEDAEPAPLVVGEGLIEYKCNYFLGNDPNRWHPGVPNYSRIVYRDLYPGIDLAFYGKDGTIEYDYIVHPGADPSAITLRYDGVQSTGVDRDGNLVLVTTWGELTHHMPRLYQILPDGEQSPMSGGFCVSDDGTVRFDLSGWYDPTLALVIDPVLNYSTYLGGSNGLGGDDYGYAVAVDGSGNAYITGHTWSDDFPITIGSNPGSVDAFVTKLSTNGNAPVYSTYLGGTNLDRGFDIAVDGSGNACVVGSAGSGFPVVNFFQGTWMGGTNDPADAFVTKLNPAGGLGAVGTYSTYLGGSGDDYAYGIAVDGSGDAYVTGSTASTVSTGFPIVNFYQNNNNGGSIFGMDAFAAKLSVDVNGKAYLVYSTFLGGSGEDRGHGIAVDGVGNAYLTGGTWSTDFPTVPYQTTPGGHNAFVTKLSLDVNGKVYPDYSTYLGGSDDDEGEGIALDVNGNAYVTGWTGSNNFPTVPLQIAPGGVDAFVTKLNPVGNWAGMYSTYLGGTSYDEGRGIAVDGSGDAYVTGSTNSADFPTVCPYQATKSSGKDAFVTKLNSAGNLAGVRTYSTFLGGGADDDGWGIAVDASGRAYVTGQTASSNFPIANPYQQNQGGCDAFVTKISMPRDYCIADSPTDQCLEPDVSGLGYVPWTSQAIFNTLNGPSTNPNDHLDPVYGQTNYLNIQYKNAGVGPVSGTIECYWVPSATAAFWDVYGYGGGATNGNWHKIPQTITLNSALPPNATAYGSIAWSPPPPGNYCFLTRLISTDDPMTFAEVKNTAHNVEYDNNVTARNLTVVSKKKSWHDLIVRNGLPLPRNISITFRRPPGESGNDYLNYGSLSVVIGPELYEKWVNGGSRGEGVVCDPSGRITVLDLDSAWIGGMAFDVGEEHQIKLLFSLPDAAPPDYPPVRTAEVFQFSESDGDYLKDFHGGMTYAVDLQEIYRPPMICLDALSALSGQQVAVAIRRVSGDLPFGGFDLLVAYDRSALSFVTATRGALLDSLSWEYFTFRTGADGNCNGSCPSGLVHLIAIADLDNGPLNHPIVSAMPGDLAILRFQVSSDRNLIGQCAPIQFYWIDCGDNAVASVTGDTTYLDRRILDQRGDVRWDEEDDVQFPEDARQQGLGAPDSCLRGGGPGKPTPEREIDFCDGWVCIIEPPDDRGDINLDGMANSVADAVLFSNYFINGIDVFESDPNLRQVQILTTDINDDGIVLTVADLVYLIRIITGDANPFPPGGNPKLTPYQRSASAIMDVGSDRATVTANSPVDFGGAVFTFRYSGLTVGDAVLSNAASQMVVKSKADRGELRVLVAPMMNVKGARVSAGINEILSIPTEGDGTIELVDVQVSDAEGNLLTTSVSKAIPTEYALLQNYPNPFNAGTIIPFGLKELTDWTLNVYNITGQTVRSFSGNGQGQIQVVWDGTDNRGRPLASGVYLYRLETRAFTATKKMTLVK